MITFKQVLASFINRKLKRPTLEARLYACAYPLIKTEWHGMPMLVGLRNLSSAQLYGIGDINVISTFYDKVFAKKQLSVEDMSRYAELHHEILKQAMAVPTYDEMIKIAGAHINMAEVEKNLAETKELFNKTPKGAEKIKLKAIYDGLELASKFVLPNEFTATLVAWSIGIGRTDIEKITHDMLVRAYINAKQGHDNPADHLDGVFERYPGDTFIKENINSQARIAYEREIEKSKKKPIE